LLLGERRNLGGVQGGLFKGPPLLPSTEGLIYESFLMMLLAVRKIIKKLSKEKQGSREYKISFIRRTNQNEYTE